MSSTYQSTLDADLGGNDDRTNGVVILIVAKPSPETLSYQSNTPSPVPMQGGFTLTLDVVGPQALISQLRASNLILSIQKLQTSGEGHRMVSAADAKTSIIQFDVDKASVEGIYSSKPYQFDFLKSAPPQDIAQDQLRQIAWALGMGGRHFKQGSNGEYVTADDNDDAQAEALGVLIDAPVRLPGPSVQVGEEWATEWSGDRHQKDNGAAFQYKQKAKIAQLIEAAPRRARIEFQTSARLDTPGDKNRQIAESTLEAKGAILLDLTSGAVLSIQSSGVITTEVKMAGLKIVRTIDSKYEQK